MDEKNRQKELSGEDSQLAAESGLIKKPAPQIHCSAAQAFSGRDGEETQIIFGLIVP